MRGCFKAAMAFGLVAAFSASAFAQGGRGGMGGGMGGPVNLLGNPAVQKELKMDDEQTEKVKTIAAEVREKMMGLNDQLSDLQGQERMAKMQELSKPITESAMKKVAGILKPEQVKRLEEIEIQQRGARALSDPMIAKKLGITEEQTEKIKSIMTDMQSESREIRESAGDDRQAMMAKMQALTKETNAKVMALMTPEQKKTWEEMTGKAFTVPPMQRPAR